MPNQSLVFLGTRGSYHLCTYAKSLQSRLTFCHPMDRSPPGSLSLEFSRQESWSGLPFPSPEDLPGPGIKPTSFRSPVLAGRFFTISATWEAQNYHRCGGNVCLSHLSQSVYRTFLGLEQRRKRWIEETVDFLKHCLVFLFSYTIKMPSCCCCCC